MRRGDVLMLLAVCDHYDIDISTSFEVVSAAQKYRSASPKLGSGAGTQVLLKSSLDVGFASSQRTKRLVFLHFTAGRYNIGGSAQRKEGLADPEKRELRTKFVLDRNWK
jgi:hypothetical protein